MTDQYSPWYVYKFYGVSPTREKCGPSFFRQWGRGLSRKTQVQNRSIRALPLVYRSLSQVYLKEQKRLFSSQAVFSNSIEVHVPGTHPIHGRGCRNGYGKPTP